MRQFFAIIHYQKIDRNQIDDIIKQLHLLSLYDRLAVALITSSSKIPQVYIDGMFCYTSDVKAKHNDFIMGTSYYEKFFKTDNNFNIPFKEGVFLSRVKMPDGYSYIESNDPLDEKEITMIAKYEEIFHAAFTKSKDEIQQWIN